MKNVYAFCVGVREGGGIWTKISLYWEHLPLLGFLATEDLIFFGQCYQYQFVLPEKSELFGRIELKK